MRPSSLLCLLAVGEAGARRLVVVQPAFNFKGRFGVGSGGGKGDETPVDELSADGGEYEYYDDEAEAKVVGKMMIGGAVAVAAWGGGRLWRCRDSLPSWLGDKISGLRRRFSIATHVATVDEGSLNEAWEAEPEGASQSSMVETEEAAEPEVTAPTPAVADQPEVTRLRAISTEALAPSSSSLEGF